MGKHKKTLKEEDIAAIIDVYNKLLHIEEEVNELQKSSCLNTFIKDKVTVTERSIKRVIYYYKKRWNTIFPE